MILQFNDIEAKKMRFDVVMSFDIDHKDGLEIIRTEIQNAYPEYTLMIIPDVDISD